MSNWERRAQGVMRIMIGFTFSCHGAQKLLGLFGGMGGHRVHAGTLLWFAGMLELILGLTILFGFFTRPAAFILCGEMAVAYFLVHFPRSVVPIQNGGELAVVYCFVFLFLAVAGPGAFSIDGARGGGGKSRVRR